MYKILLASPKFAKMYKIFKIFGIWIYWCARASASFYIFIFPFLTFIVNPEISQWIL